MRFRGLLSILLFFILINNVQGAYYWVFLSDKNKGDFDPYAFFDARAIERRMRHNLPLSDSTDWPINESYKQSIVALEVLIMGESRWLNALAVEMSLDQVDVVQNLKFVKRVQISAGQDMLPCRKLTSNTDGYGISDDEMEILKEQTKILGAEVFSDSNIDGKGIRIAVFDAGFPGVDKNFVFNHLHNSNRIIKTYDFIKNRENVYAKSSHGTSVLSCIAGIFGDHKVGLATGAEFLLARTETASIEPFWEEKNWLQAAEWADKNGAHIISSSLAYTKNRYFKTQMDGQTSFVAQAARFAVRKGILVINAAGNDGDAHWKVIATPADVDSVLTVGGVDPKTGMHIYFSSFGPNAKKQIKPNVSAFGHVVAATEEGMNETFGTSFATPLIAGFAACLMQKFPTYTNLQIFELIQKLGSLYPYYDYAHGYGVPTAKNLGRISSTDKDTTCKEVEFVSDKFSIRIMVNDVMESDTASKDLDSYVDALFRKDSLPLGSEAILPSYLYYHIENANKVLSHYYVIEVYQKEAVVIDRNLLPKGSILRVYYKGVINEMKF